MILVLAAVGQNFLWRNGDISGQIIVEPIVPGVNLPASELGYYGLALIVCSVIHEVGHALAAVREDVHLINVGVNVLFVLPVAYVNISSEKLNSLNPWRTLRIICAGVWHNIVLVAIAYLIYCALPTFFSGLFYVNNGIYISEMHKNSPLVGLKGLSKGDTITKINDCNIQNETSFVNCLKNLQTHKPAFCVDTDLVHELDESVPLRHISNGFYDCCSPNKNEHLCFEYLENNDGIIEIPPHVCLPVRAIVEKSPGFCSTSKSCPNGLHCIRPILANATNLFIIKVLGKNDVLYIGLWVDFLQTIVVSPYVPKYMFGDSTVPDVVTKFLKYIVVFSCGLAVINVFPCVFMDGQHITKGLLQIFFTKHLGSAHNVNLTSLIVSLCGTMLLVFHTVCSIYGMVRG